MDVAAQRRKQNEIYERFEAEASEYKKHAICEPGCAFCCTHFGRVDITTLEGLVIREWINRLRGPLKAKITKALARNKRDKEKGGVGKCPFLNKKNQCCIYDIRPFSCRQLYSVRECSERGPTVHRQVMDLAKNTIRELQRLDDVGYSGHLSFILYMLDKPLFRKVYQAGEFDPGKIMAFGKTHAIIINRVVSG